MHTFNSHFTQMLVKAVHNLQDVWSQHSSDQLPMLLPFIISSCNMHFQKTHRYKCCNNIHQMLSETSLWNDHFNVFKCWRQHKHLLKTVVIQAKLIFAEWHHKAFSRGELFPYYKTTPKLLIILVIVHCSKHPRYCLDTVFQLSTILECEQQICSSHHKVYIWQP